MSDVGDRDVLLRSWRTSQLDLLAARPGQPWHQRGACRTSELDFFEERPAAVDAACAVCAGCPVVPQCAAFGRDERYGISGGTTTESRALAWRRAG